LEKAQLNLSFCATKLVIYDICVEEIEPEGGTSWGDDQYVYRTKPGRGRI